MKKIYLLLLTSYLLVSCNKNLDKFPIDSPSNETFYSSQAEILMAVNACYPYIGARTPIFPTIPAVMMSDLVTDVSATRLTTTSYVAFKSGQLNSNQDLSSFWWNNCYQGINRTNALLDNIGRAEASSDPAIFKRIKSEARVIRVIMYTYLLQNYGDVPLITHNISIDEGLNQTRTPKADILKFIYSEIDEAAADLPAKYTATNDKGRITKGCAYAIKARIALYNGDWAVAKAAAKACMDLNVYKLYPSYHDLFSFKAINNDEIILDDQYMAVNKTSAYMQFNGPRNSQGQSQSFPTEDLVESFECTDGKLVSESPLYDPRNPFANRDPRLAGAIMLPRVWDGTTVNTYGTVFNGIEIMSSKEKLFAAGSTTDILPTSLGEKEKTVYDSKTQKNITNQEVTNPFSSFTGYIANKYMDSIWVATPAATYTNFILCRYPEVLLTYAEASIELGTVDQTVLDAINMARARAYGNTNSSGDTDIDAANYPRVITTDIADLRRIVRRERKIELCFEGFRLQDLKRWGILQKALSQRINYGRPENFSKLSPTDIPVFDADELVKFPYATDKYGLNNEQTKLRYFETYGIIPENYNLLPIPLNEIQLNPKLTQNPGY